MKTTRVTIFLESDLLKALRLQTVKKRRSVSKLVNDAVRLALREDQEDLAAFEERGAEPTISYEALLKVLKRSGPRARRPSSSRPESL